MEDLALSQATSLALLQATQGDSKKSLNELQNAVDLSKAEAAAQEFEAVFIAEMMKPMFEGISTDGMFGGGKGEEVFRSILLQEYGSLIAQTGSIGLSAQVKDAIIQMQEAANNNTDTLN